MRAEFAGRPQSVPPRINEIRPSPENRRRPSFARTTKSMAGSGVGAPQGRNARKRRGASIFPPFIKTIKRAILQHLPEKNFPVRAKCNPYLSKAQDRPLQMQRTIHGNSFLSNEIGVDLLLVNRRGDACGAARFDALQQPCKVLRQCAHGLQSLFVLQNLLRPVAVHLIPVL